MFIEIDKLVKCFIQGDDDELSSGFHLNAPGVAAASGFALKFWFLHWLTDWPTNFLLVYTVVNSSALWSNWVAEVHSGRVARCSEIP